MFNTQDIFHLLNIGLQFSQETRYIIHHINIQDIFHAVIII